MSEEEKKLIEKFNNLYIKEFNNEPITSDDRLSYIECALITNLIEKQQKELEQEKEKNTELRIQISARETVVDELREKIEEIRDKAEVMDYYTLNDVIDDLTKLLEG